MAVASPDSYFALSQGKHGVGPALGLTLGAPVLGKRLLTEMALTGRRVSAEEAERRGLVNVVSRGVEEAVEKLAAQISETPPSLVRAMKEVLLRQMSMAGYEIAFDYIALFSQSKEMKEGIAKFLSKES
jgi:enoyl-CoA hydratase/carnithine racemase